MTKNEAENLLNKHLKRYDKYYKEIQEIKCAEFKDNFSFGVIYKNKSHMNVYCVFKHNKDVILAPT